MKFSSDEQIARLVEKVENGKPTKTDAANFSRLLREMVEEVISEEADKKLIDKVLAFLKKQPDYENAAIKKFIGDRSPRPRVQITNLGGDKARKKIAQLLTNAGFEGVEVLDYKNLNIGGQSFEWIQGSGVTTPPTPCVATLRLVLKITLSGVSNTL